MTASSPAEAKIVPSWLHLTTLTDLVWRFKLATKLTSISVVKPITDEDVVVAVIASLILSPTSHN